MQWLKKLVAPRPAAPLDEATWRRTAARYRFIADLDDDESARLRELAAEFIARKSFSGAGGLDLTDEIVVAIAAQACLPVLHLGLHMFDEFSEVIVYPGEFHVEREVVDDDGVVHDASGALSGEAMPGGPVVVSWEDAQTGFDDGYNVVIHEFAHKLDMAAGEDADGVPRFDPGLHRELSRAVWIETLDEAYEDFCDRVDDLEANFPPELDPQSDAGLARYARLPLDAYASEHPAEFFAVASETYFVAPARLRGAYPELYFMLDRYYRPPGR